MHLLLLFNSDHTIACAIYSSPSVCVCIHVFAYTRHSTDSSVFPAISFQSLIEDSRTQLALQLDRALLFITPHKITEKVWPWFSWDWQPNTHFLNHRAAIRKRLCSIMMNHGHYIPKYAEETQVQGCEGDLLPEHSTLCPAEIKQTCIHTIHLILTFISIINDIQIYWVINSPRLSLGCIQSRRLCPAVMSVFMCRNMCIRRYVYSLL